MTNRKTATGLYRVLLLIALIVATLSLSAFCFGFAKTAHADESTAEYADESATEHADDSAAAHGNFDHATATEISATFKELSPGSYYLTDDVVLTNQINMRGGLAVKLCLHGHTLTATNRYAFVIYSGSKLELYDCGGDDDNCGKITVKGVRVEGGVFSMYGGAIRDTKGNYGSGGAVTILSNGIFNMYGGEITDNEAGGSCGGGGVYVAYQGNFNMYDGLISRNAVTKKGGAGVLVADVTGDFHMHGGSITNNVIKYPDNSDPETVEMFYCGAGVYVNGGSFSLDGNANISGNVRGTTDPQNNNLELGKDCKINITGKLGDDARIGVTAQGSDFTRGYAAAGNTKNPSEYFTCDDDSLSINYNIERDECAIVDAADNVEYTMEDAWVTGATDAVLGATEVTFTIDVKLKPVGGTSVKTTTVFKKITLGSPLQTGKNTGKFNYTYNGKTLELSYEIDLAKPRAYVTWACSGASSTGSNTARRNYDGSDVLSSITASYTGSNGETVRVSGAEPNKIVAEDADGNRVSSTAGIGVYKFYLAPSDDYTFDNNQYTVTVVGSTADGYYQMQDASVVSVTGTPIVGDTTITVTISRQLKHTQNQSVTNDTVSYTATLTSALKVGNNTVNFTYTYTDLGGGVQTKQLSASVTAGRKQVAVRWYFDGSLASGNAADHIYDGNDLSDKIIAEFDGYDGEQKRINGANSFMLKSDANASFVTTLNNVGVYTLSIADAADYVFTNNSFTYTVIEGLSDVSDLVYQESEQDVLGVSSDNGFESGTELTVERMDCDPSVVDGKINTALNVRFFKDSAEITPTGSVTVRVLIPDELRGTTFQIYNLKNGVATPIDYITDGNFAVFELSDLSTILFVTEKTTPPIDDPIDDPDDDPIGDSDLKDDGNGYYITRYASGLIWLWILLGVLVACIIALTVVFAVRSKHSKMSATVDGGAAQQEPEHKNVKYCTACGRENDESATFCGKCGKKFDQR